MKSALHLVWEFLAVTARIVVGLAALVCLGLLVVILVPFAFTVAPARMASVLAEAGAEYRKTWRTLRDDWRAA